MGRKEYNEFHDYLAQKRTALVGDFKGIQLTNPVISYAASGVTADLDCSGVIVFIALEIVLA